MCEDLNLYREDRAVSSESYDNDENEGYDDAVASVSPVPPSPSSSDDPPALGETAGNSDEYDGDSGDEDDGPNSDLRKRTTYNMVARTGMDT